MTTGSISKNVIVRSRVAVGREGAATQARDADLAGSPAVCAVDSEEVADRSVRGRSSSAAIRAWPDPSSCDPCTVVPFISRVELAVGRREHLGDAEEAAVSELGRRLEDERRQDQHERRRQRQEPRARADQQDEPANEQPADAGLRRQRAGRDEGRDQHGRGHEVRQHPPAGTRHERAEVEAVVAARGRCSATRGDERQRDERPDQQDRHSQTPGRRAARRAPRRRCASAPPATGSGRTRSGATGPGGPGQVGRGARPPRPRTRRAP